MASYQQVKIFSKYGNIKRIFAEIPQESKLNCMDSILKEILENFGKLNDEGQEWITSYSRMLANSREYRRIKIYKPPAEIIPFASKRKEDQ